MIVRHLFILCTVIGWHLHFTTSLEVLLPPANEVTRRECLSVHRGGEGGLPSGGRPTRTETGRRYASNWNACLFEDIKDQSSFQSYLIIHRYGADGATGSAFTASHFLSRDTKDPASTFAGGVSAHLLS